MSRLASTGHSSGWIRGLLNPAAFPHPVGQLQLIETHISWVILTGDFAYKVKKPVALGFLDFSSLARRKFYCEEELRLNRRTAPDLYLDVVPIGATGQGLRVGREPAVEYAVRMRQFPAAARLDLRLQAGLVGMPEIRAAARQVALFHNALEPRHPVAREDSARRAARPALNNFVHLQAGFFDAASRQELRALRAWTRAAAERLGAAFEARASSGMVRDCHGDLHLANLFVRGAEIIPFDGIEFNPELSCIDQASDVAFMVMDLFAHGRRDLAWGFLNAWLEDTGDYPALAVLRFYLVYRAMVRVKVASIQLQQVVPEASSEPALDAQRYLRLAQTLTRPETAPRLVLMHGFSGAGKTWISQRLAPVLPAVRVRSDLERKRLHGPSAGAEASLYGAAATQRTYTALAQHCETGLRAGFNMIADATFLDAAQRRRFIALAAACGARPIILHCTASLHLLRERLLQRAADGIDASDAGLEVLRQQRLNYQPLRHDEEAIAREIDTGKPFDPDILLHGA